MREGTRNFLVGLASIIALLGLAVLLFRFGELDALLHPGYRVHLNTSNAAGLRTGSGVEYNGVPVGLVESIYVQQSADFPVGIDLTIDREANLPQSVKPFAVAALIGGGSRLELRASQADNTQPQSFYPKDGSAHIDGPISGGGMLDQITAALDERMKPLIAGLESFNKLSATYITVGENINSMLQPQSSEALAGGEPPNLRTALAKLNAAIDDVRSSLDLARQWLGDDQLRADARSAVNKARQLIDNATQAVEHYTQLADSLKANSTELVQRLLPVADTLSTTLDEVRRVALLATQGKGTIGQLLNNPDLYNSLNDAATRLERALTEAQLLIQKLKAEGFPIRL
jgi:phospholipid/cholesterol/gamma-HCH transport system substrate-binding protein